MEDLGYTIRKGRYSDKQTSKRSFPIPALVYRFDTRLTTDSFILFVSQGRAQLQRDIGLLWEDKSSNYQVQGGFPFPFTIAMLGSLYSISLKLLSSKELLNSLRGF